MQNAGVWVGPGMIPVTRLTTPDALFKLTYPAQDLGLTKRKKKNRSTALAHTS